MTKNKLFVNAQTCSSSSSPHLGHCQLYVINYSSQGSGSGSQHAFLLDLMGSIYLPKLLI